MNSEIIKHHLIEKIADRKVLAAAFYTFNFQPDFFENYVLPVVVPDVEFKNSRLYNAILWRRTVLPPTVVYYDDGIQKMPDSQGPLQDYEICPVRMRKFFHPKANFILVQNEKEEKELLILLGSNNLTRAGWCENLEASAVISIGLESEYSSDFVRSLITFIEKNKVDFGLSGEAERLIIDFLNEVTFKKQPKEVVLFNSLENNFEEFLRQHVFERDIIKHIEVFSPFFQKSIQENTPISLIKKYTDVPVHCLIPFKHGVKIQLEKEVFDNYQENGVVWSVFKNENNFKDEITERYNHSKVYKFQGENVNFTIIGSVNFTTNAWTGVENRGNMETAILFNESYSFETLLRPIKDISDDWIFLESDEQQDQEGKTFFRKSPSFDFTLNWETKTLMFKPSDPINKQYELCLFDKTEVLKKTAIFPLSKKAYEIFAENSTIKVIERAPEKNYEHYYYPHQIGLVQRPFLVKFPFKEIRALWRLLREEESSEVVERAIERLIEQYERADGSIKEDLVKEGIINKMAAHIDTLIELEYNLFQPNVTADKLTEVLVQDVFGSLPYYVRVCILDDTELNKGFAWVLLNLVLIKFYRPREEKAWQEIETSLIPIVKMLKAELKELESKVKVDKQHLNWALKMLQN